MSSSDVVSMKDDGEGRDSRKPSQKPWRTMVWEILERRASNCCYCLDWSYDLTRRANHHLHPVTG